MKVKTEEWSPDSIADGILTRYMWPGFEGTHCDKCQCSMNVMGMSYGHRCPDCDPEEKHYIMHAMHNVGKMPFENPKFGPTRIIIQAGSRRAKEISESRRKYPIGTLVMLHEYWYGRACPVETGAVVGWVVEDSYPGMRYYQVDVGGRERRQLERNMAPFRKFADSETVLMKYYGDWVPAKIIGLVDNERAHFTYRSHRYSVEIIGSPLTHWVREEDIRPRSSANPKCRWCKGKGKIILATTIQKCLDCYP